MSPKKTRTEEFKERALTWLADHPKAEGALWFLAALACIAILVWFLGFSDFGAPPEFVYEQF